MNLCFDTIISEHAQSAPILFNTWYNNIYHVLNRVGLLRWLCSSEHRVSGERKIQHQERFTRSWLFKWLATIVVIFACWRGRWSSAPCTIITTFAGILFPSTNMSNHDLSYSLYLSMLLDSVYYISGWQSNSGKCVQFALFNCSFNCLLMLLNVDERENNSI